MLLNILQSAGDPTTKNYLVQNFHGVRWRSPGLAHHFDPALSTWEAISMCRENEPQCWAGALLAWLSPMLSQGPLGERCPTWLRGGPPPQRTVGWTPGLTRTSSPWVCDPSWARTRTLLWSSALAVPLSAEWVKIWVFSLYHGAVGRTACAVSPSGDKEADSSSWRSLRVLPY